VIQRNRKIKEDGEHWLSVSDMMSGLMVIFLFIAITYMMQVGQEHEHLVKLMKQMSEDQSKLVELMKQVQDDKNQLVEIAGTYTKTKDEIYDRLQTEFQDDLKNWNAEIDKQSLSVRFQQPDVLFNMGEAELKDQFKNILNDFFPRYIEILKHYLADIEEIRIEGHTSSEWNNNVGVDETYFLNMALSQNRTRATLEHCLMLPKISAERSWIRQILTANGLSSSKPILVNGNEDTKLSRRVEFRIKTNSENQIMKILKRKPT
jgi:outer membrane protein OmpA-like peptidoglycan-associated protein